MGSSYPWNLSADGVAGETSDWLVDGRDSPSTAYVRLGLLRMGGGVLLRIKRSRGRG